jgi:hypothetical protein
LFEAKRLYIKYKRFTHVIKGELLIENISVPLKLSKKHLLLIAKYCKTESQQNIFIEKVKSESLNAHQLEYQLKLNLSSKEKDVLLIIDDLSLKTTYDLTPLKIHSD